jgi:hypothetical protein
MSEIHRENTLDLVKRLSDLYRTSPKAFEEQKQQLITSIIEEFPEEHRARAYGLQFRIDTELSRCKDPVSRLNRMVELFWDGVGRFQDVLNDPEKILQERRENQAKVISLPPRKDLH